MVGDEQRKVNAGGVAGQLNQKKKINPIDKRYTPEPIRAPSLLTKQPKPARWPTFGKCVTPNSYTQRQHRLSGMVLLAPRIVTAMVIHYQ